MGSYAIKFTPSGGYITVRTKDTDDCVEVHIEDTGPGIPTAIKEHIFEPYFSTTGSTGVGLSLAKGIIELHGGQIKSENRENGGCIFTLTLPKSDPKGGEINEQD